MCVSLSLSLLFYHQRFLYRRIFLHLLPIAIPQRANTTLSQPNAFLVFSQPATSDAFLLFMDMCWSVLFTRSFWSNLLSLSLLNPLFFFFPFFFIRLPSIKNPFVNFHDKKSLWLTCCLSVCAQFHFFCRQANYTHPRLPPSQDNLDGTRFVFFLIQLHSRAHTAHKL